MQFYNLFACYFEPALVQLRNDQPSAFVDVLTGQGPGVNEWAKRMRLERDKPMSTLTRGQFFQTLLDEEATEIEQLTREATAEWARWWDVGSGMAQAMYSVPSPLINESLQPWLDRLYAPIECLDADEKALVKRLMPQGAQRSDWILPLAKAYLGIRDGLSEEIMPHFFGGIFRLGDSSLKIRLRSNSQIHALLDRLQQAGWPKRLMLETRNSYEHGRQASTISHFHRAQRKNSFDPALRLALEEDGLLRWSIVSLTNLEATAAKFGRKSKHV